MIRATAVPPISHVSLVERGAAFRLGAVQCWPPRPDQAPKRFTREGVNNHPIGPWTQRNTLILPVGSVARGGDAPLAMTFRV